MSGCLPLLGFLTCIFVVHGFFAAVLSSQKEYCVDLWLQQKKQANCTKEGPFGTSLSACLFPSNT